MNPSRLLLLVGLAALAAAPARAQDDSNPPMVDPPSPVDVRVLRAIYHTDTPLARALMHGANESSVPIFIGAAPAAWVGALVTRTDFEAAYRLTLAELGTIGMMFAIKNVFRRPRPYATWPDIVPRAASHLESDQFDPFSFPSGHAATAFAIATSIGLSSKEWYVIVPAGLWAGAVALSRPWLGVHYPTDILAGAALGTGVALVVHIFSEYVTPGFLEEDENGGEEAAARPAPPVFVLRIPL